MFQPISWMSSFDDFLTLSRSALEPGLEKLSLRPNSACRWTILCRGLTPATAKKGLSCLLGSPKWQCGWDNWDKLMPLHPSSQKKALRMSFLSFFMTINHPFVHLWTSFWWDQNHKTRNTQENKFTTATAPLIKCLRPGRPSRCSWRHSQSRRLRT